MTTPSPTPPPTLPPTREIKGEDRVRVRRWAAAEFRRSPNVLGIARQLGRSDRFVEYLLSEAGIDHRSHLRTRIPCPHLVGEARQATLDELAEEYQTQTALTVRTLAARHNLTVRAAHGLLAEAGVEIRSTSLRGPARAEYGAELRRRYDQDESLTVSALAQTVPQSMWTVRRLLLEAGATIRHGRPSTLGQTR